MTVMPSYAIASSTYWMPAEAHVAASASLILREASLMSVSPVQGLEAVAGAGPGDRVVEVRVGGLERLCDRGRDRLHRGRAGDVDRAADACWLRCRRGAGRFRCTSARRLRSAAGGRWCRCGRPARAGSQDDRGQQGQNPEGTSGVASSPVVPPGGRVAWTRSPDVGSIVSVSTVNGRPGPSTAVLHFVKARLTVRRIEPVADPSDGDEMDWMVGLALHL